MEFKIIVNGKPRGKARPRMGRNGVVYTPPQTKEYENKIKAEFIRKYRNTSYEKDTAIAVEIIAYYAIPISLSKEIKGKMLKGQILPTKKPDADNIAKIVCDALNGLAYYDDSQITNIKIKKAYSINPRIEVSIKEQEI